MNMGTETNSSPSSSPAPAPPPPAAAATPSSSGKRSRDPEDEVYVDNLHSHKRYLSEIMASSLNGLSVGDDQPLSDNLMESPARSESMFYLRDEMPYSPMSEDSDDSRYLETSTNTCSSLSDSRPTSPVSPYRNQRLLSGNYAPYPCPYSSVSASQARPRGSDSEGRFPSSPSDICHSADLRRAALMRSVQMRTQPSGPLSSNQESGQSMETEERPCLDMKSLVDESGQSMETEERPCLDMKSLVDDGGYIEECPVLSMVESESETQEKPCETVVTNLTSDNPRE